MISKLKFAPAMVLAATLIGCATQPPVQRIPFPEAEHAALPKTGTGKVIGQAFLTTRGGEVRTAAGREIKLNPVTSYSLQWYEAGYLANRDLTPFDPRGDKYIVITVANAQGNFTFKNVPPGEYFATTAIVWDAPFAGTVIQTGGVVTKRIAVRDGQETEVMLTR